MNTIRMSDGMDPRAPSDPALDFLSPAFDPALALATPGLVPPDPNALPMDNVSKCRSILPPELPESLSNMVKKQASEESKLKASQFKERAAKLTQRIRDSCTISLDKVLHSVKPGPIRVMANWLEAGLRVRVVTRHGRGVRGVATGRLVAYDRYMNVLLCDVVEDYTVRVRVTRERVRHPAPAADTSAPIPSGAASSGGVEAGAGEGPGIGAGMARVVFRPNTESADADPVEPGELGEVAVAVPAAEPLVKVITGHRQEQRHRRLAQIFIKGDNIVLISPEEQLMRVQQQGQGAAASG